MQIVTLRVPKPFSESVDDWPEGLKQDGMSQLVVIGQSNGGLDLCELIVDDDWDITAIPSGWRATSSHLWDMVSQHEYDENGDLIKSVLTTELPTNQSDYSGHIPDDENGDPVAYHRIHKFQGVPEILD